MSTIFPDCSKLTIGLAEELEPLKYCLYKLGSVSTPLLEFDGFPLFQRFNYPIFMLQLQQDLKRRCQFHRWQNLYRYLFANLLISKDHREQFYDHSKEKTVLMDYYDNAINSLSQINHLERSKAESGKASASRLSQSLYAANLRSVQNIEDPLQPTFVPIHPTNLRKETLQTQDDETPTTYRSGDLDLQDRKTSLISPIRHTHQSNANQARYFIAYPLIRVGVGFTKSKWKYCDRPKIENRNGASEKTFSYTHLLRITSRTS
ncbi:unnamed protein product, partial [Nesidiocoris tenuis]